MKGCFGEALFDCFVLGVRISQFSCRGDALQNVVFMKIVKNLDLVSDNVMVNQSLRNNTDYVFMRPCELILLLPMCPTTSALE